MNREEYDLALERNNDITDALAYANGEIKYTNIKGKDYAEVKERIAAFRRVYPEGAISTKIILEALLPSPCTPSGASTIKLSHFPVQLSIFEFVLIESDSG